QPVNPISGDADGVAESTRLALTPSSATGYNAAARWPHTRNGLREHPLRLLRPTTFARPLLGDAALPAVRWPHVYNRLARTHTLLALLGVAVLVWWATFWVGSLQKNHLKRSPVTWFGRYEFLG